MNKQKIKRVSVIILIGIITVLVFSIAPKVFANNTVMPKESSALKAK